MKKTLYAFEVRVFLEIIFNFFQNLLASHDIVAQRDYLPKLNEVPIEVDEDEETVKIVQLVKSHEPLVNKPYLIGS